MSSKTINDNILILKINTENLTRSQTRLIKSLNHMIVHILNTDDESDFFQW